MKAGELLSILSQTGSAPFTPSQVAGMVEWHAATSLSLTDGDPIGTWADLSGNGFSATATTTARPTYKTNVVNSHPVARFNGTSNCLTLGFTGTKSQPNTYYIVLTDATGNVNHYQDDASFATRNLVGINSTAYQIYAGSVLTGGVRTLDTFQIIEVVFNGASSFMTVNGTTVITTANVGSQGFGGTPSLGGGGPSFPYKGDIAEYIFYNAAVSSGDRTSIRSYLGTKYNIVTI